MRSFFVVLCGLAAPATAFAIPIGDVCRGSPPACTMPDGCSGQKLCDEGVWTGCDYAYTRQSYRSCTECGLGAKQACGVGPTFYGPCTAACTTASGQPGEVTSCTATGAPICQLPYRQRFPFPSTTPGLGNSLGVNLHTDQVSDAELDLLRDAGVRFVRLDTSVNDYLADPQGYWSGRWGSFLDRLDARGLRAIMILGGFAVGPPFASTGYAQFSQYARDGATALKERGILWEVWNEPNLRKFWNGLDPSSSDYALLAANVNLAIKLATPDEWIIGPALGHNGEAYLDDLLGRGYILGYWDGITIHPYEVSEGPAAPYCSPAPEWLTAPAYLLSFAPYISCGAVLQQYRSVVAAHIAAGQKTPPILVGEWGYNTARTSQQPEYAAREWLTGYVGGVPLTVYYHWKDLPQDTARYGLADPQGVPTRSYWALRFVVTRLSSATYLDSPSAYPRVPVQYHFRSAASQEVYVAYGDSPGNATISVYPGTYRIETLDLSTNPPVVQSRLQSTGTTLTLWLTAMPTILTRVSIF